MAAAKFFRRWYVLALLATGIVLLIGPCRFGYYSVCSVCGKIRHTSQRKLPLLEVPYWTENCEEETPLSEACRATGLVGDHQHEWLFGHGNNGGLSGFSCALGSGELITAASQSKEAAAFIKCVVRFESKDKAENWRKRLLDPLLSPAAVGAIENIGKFPAAGFDNAAEYVEWKKAHEKAVEDSIEEYRTHYLRD